MPDKPIHRRQATSGNVQYGDPVVLYESNRSRVTFIPFFVPRTSRTELSCKIQTYRKADPPFGWALIDEKSLSLNEAANRRLLAALRDHLAVAGDSADEGEYLVLRLDDGNVELRGHDPAIVASALARALGHDEIVRHLANTDLASTLTDAVRGAIRLQEMREAVAQLRLHLQQNIGDEQVYQKWCEEHSWAFGNAYVARDRIRSISAGDNLDLLLPTVISGYRDIVELKRPDMDVILFDRRHRNHYFSADVSRAIGQVHRYLDVLREVASNGLHDHPEVVAYHPRGTIVIGRSRGWSTEEQRALHGLNARLSGISIMTYDHLLNQGERLVQMMSNQSSDTSEPPDSDAELHQPDESWEPCVDEPSD